MGLQLIVKADLKKIEKTLGSLTSECEIFPVAEDFWVFQLQRELSHPWVRMLFYTSLNNSSILTSGKDAGKNPSDVGSGEFRF